jgi:hypothetical protein
MKKHTILAGFLTMASVFFGVTTAQAQKDTVRLKQEVEVTKAYQPTILDAVKINDIPKIKTEQTEAPTFDYSIYSKPIFSTFEPTPVAAAKMVGDPRPEMGNGLLKLGIGNYLTPYGELFYNAQPDKNSNFGLHFKHLSSSGDIKLLNGDKVNAPHSENQAEIYGKRFFKKSTLSGSLGYDRKAFNYYGYAGDELSDSLKEQMIPFFGDKQWFSKGTVDVHLKSETLSKDDFNYDFGVNYHFLSSKTGQKEGQTVVSADLGKKFGNMFGILNFSMTSYRADSILNGFSNTFGEKHQMLMTISPSVKWLTKNASLQLGLNTTISQDDDTDGAVYFYPKVKAEWSPVERVLTLFAGADGHVQHNTYSSIATENPYVNPYHDLENTRYQVVVSGGFKGKLSPKTNYVAEASYSVVKDQHFYFLNTYELNNPYPIRAQSISNTFDWVYDDVNIFKLSGEVLHTVSDNFSIHLLGNYYSYEMKSKSKAWQMPNFDLTLSGIYQASDKLKFTTDIFVVGSRTALIRDNWLTTSTPGGGYGGYYSYVGAEKEQILDPIIDLNAGVEYQYSKKLNFFVKLNNFGFQKYERWLGYTNKSFNALVGASYKF